VFHQANQLGTQPLAALSGNAVQRKKRHHRRYSLCVLGTGSSARPIDAGYASGQTPQSGSCAEFDRCSRPSLPERRRWRCAIRGIVASLAALVALPGAAMAGPPYMSDDPEPTDYQHYEIYLFSSGTNTRGGTSGAAGLDFNYGAAPDLQLTAVLPIAYESPKGAAAVAGPGNIELAAKYRFLHQSAIGWDVAVFPRLFLPSASARVGDQHASLLLPLWLERDWGPWSTFGGGGCEINRGDGAQDFCLAGWALTRQILPKLRLGAELVHQTASSKGGRATTGIGVGLAYDLNDTYHLLAYAGPGLQNAAETDRYSWYVSVLFTF
jgi:hypothetical protein